MFRSVYIAIISFFIGQYWWAIVESFSHVNWFLIGLNAFLVVAIIGGYWIAGIADYTVRDWVQTRKARKELEARVYREYIEGLRKDGILK